MSDVGRTDGESGAPTEFEEGRYVYCAVRADDDDAFSTEGIEGRPVSLVVEDGVGAVVQPVESVYDSDDLTQVRSWLLDHQQVVDDAGQRFGTPIPFRFDTIVRGDDATVREWIADRHDELTDGLDRLAGRWEYRIRLEWDEAAVTETLLEGDAELRELAERAEAASEGTGFLLEKQYGQRLSEALERRRAAVEERLYEAVEPHAVEVQRSGGSGALSDGDGGDGGTVADLSLLADGDREGDVGDSLEPFAEEPAYEVSYTGPWPPYSFAPAIGDGGDGEP